MRVVSLRQARLPKLAAIMIVIATAVAAGLASHAGASPISRIAVIGDSYTAGSGEGGNGPRSWPELATALLARDGVEIEADIAAEAARLGLDAGMSWSCYDPSPDNKACGRCDSCRLRAKGFADAGLVDPTVYA